MHFPSRRSRFASLLAALPIVYTSSSEAAQPLVTDDAAVVAPKPASSKPGFIRCTRATNTGRSRRVISPATSSSRSALRVRIPTRASNRASFSCKRKPCCFRATTGRGRSARSAAARETPGRRTGARHSRRTTRNFSRPGIRVTILRSTSISAPPTRTGREHSRSRPLPSSTRSSRTCSCWLRPFAANLGPGKYQVGIRYIVVPDRFEAYVSYGNPFNGASSQWSTIIGIRVQTAAFLP